MTVIGDDICDDLSLSPGAPRKTAAVDAAVAPIELAALFYLAAFSMGKIGDQAARPISTG